MAGSPTQCPASPTSAPCPSATLSVLLKPLPGSYKEAGARLQEALHPTPPSEAARARRGLLLLKKGDVPAAAQDLQCLAETDSRDLGFLLSVLKASERQSLAQVRAALHGASFQPLPSTMGAQGSFAFPVC